MKKILSLLLVALLVLTPIPVRATQLLGVGTVTTSQGPLNVRNSPGGRVVTTLPKGGYVMLLGKSGNWYQVQYGKTATGYCHADYITPVAGTPATVTAGALNVRSGPGTSHTVKDYLQNGQQVVVLSSSQGWSRVVYHGIKTGFVSGKYLSGAGVELSVPRYLQTDSRWANVPIGNSTMARIGCATTGIAMLESYRTGTAIYPDAMAKKLKYTASGSVYWPGHYSVVTAYSLPTIKALLDSGKPVLLGAKNRAGTQHWVVVTGYTGRGTEASQFLINDPGTSSRVNLAQFLNVYPTFYKYFHY